MERFKIYEKLPKKAGKYEQIEISIDYSLGGTNYFSGSFSPRGIYAYLTPCSYGENGFMERTLLGNKLESGYKICLEELKRGSQKKINYWSEKIKGITGKIAELYPEEKDKEIASLIRDY